MLMMGLTGVFVHSVYAGDDSTFQSKGWQRFYFDYFFNTETRVVNCKAWLYEFESFC